MRTRTLILLCVVYVVYAAFFSPYIFAALPKWNLVLPAQLLAVAAPFFIWYSWRHRGQLTRADYQMLFVPLVVWLGMAMATQVVTWRFYHGRAEGGLYGVDKSLSNVIVEPPIVLLFAALPLLRFAIEDPNARAAAGRRLRILALAAAALTAVFVPGLGE